MSFVILGGGGHAAVLVDLLEKSKVGEILGFLDDNTECKLLGLPHLGPINGLATLPANCTTVVVGIGNMQLRAQWLEFAQSKELECPVLIHPRACVSQYASIGAGTVVMAGAIIQARARLGKGVIINTGATIDHDTTIGHFTHIAPGAHIAGDVHIGSRCLLGIGSSVIPGTKIDDDALVAAGSVVVQNISKGTKVAGVPAKLMQKKYE
jgi:sugar O-acyltransferase (sialic acid O-acetyltransferase NeuD family)